MIGAAFGKIVTALVDSVVMPLVTLALPSGNWRAAGVVLRRAADPKDDVVVAPRLCVEVVTTGHPWKNYVSAPEKYAAAGVGEL